MWRAVLRYRCPATHLGLATAISDCCRFRHMKPRYVVLAFVLLFQLPAFAQLGESTTIGHIAQASAVESINETVRARKAEELRRQEERVRFAEQESRKREKAQREYASTREVARAAIRNLRDTPDRQQQLDRFTCMYPPSATLPPTSQAVDDCLGQLELLRERAKRDAVAQQEKKAEQERVAEEERKQQEARKAEQERKAEAARIAKAAADKAAEEAAEHAAMVQKFRYGLVAALGLAAVFAVGLFLRKRGRAIMSRVDLKIFHRSLPEFEMTLPVKRQTLAYVGSLVLLGGVFAPIVRVPILGTVNYFQNGRGDGVIVLVLAVISLYLTATKQYRKLWATGLASAAVLTFTFIAFQVRVSDIKSTMNRDLEGNPFRGLADVAVQGIQLEWGWILLVVGAGMIMLAAAVKNDSGNGVATDPTLQGPLTRSLQSNEYQLYLVRTYQIEKNNALEKYVVRGKLFVSIDDALRYAHAMDVGAEDQENAAIRTRQVPPDATVVGPPPRRVVTASVAEREAVQSLAKVPTHLESWLARRTSGEPLALVLKDLQHALDQGELTPPQFAVIRRELLLI